MLLASSGKIELGRPDKLRATRLGGFANVEMVFDGKTVTLVGKDINRYTQVELPGTLEHLVDAMRDKLGKPVPGGDLLLPDAYDKLMEGVTNVKDLGSGVIGVSNAIISLSGRKTSTGRFGLRREKRLIPAAT